MAKVNTLSFGAIRSGMQRAMHVGPADRLMAHLRVPLYRNGYALIFSSFTASGLGMFFWILAARAYSADAVGLNSAALSSMLLLSNIAQLNLMNALNRFVPTAGRRTTKLVAYTYLVVTAAALVAGVVFLLGTEIWAPALVALRANPVLAVWYVFSVVIWTVFVLQDSTLTGLRQAIWVPVENISFAVLKIVLLVVFALFLPGFGLLVSWTVAAALTLIPVNYLVFRRLIPRHIEATKHAEEAMSLRQISAYVAGNYVATLAWQAAIGLLPIIVVERLGASANAYYYLSWTTAYSLYLLARNMGMSLITEAATEPKLLVDYSRKVFVQTGRMLVPIVLLAVAAAPLILRLFGSDYAEHAPGVFRLLVLSALPNTVITLYLSIARVKNHIRKIVFVQVAVSVLAVGVSYVLIGTHGINGIGAALLGTQTAIAVALLATELRFIWWHDGTITTLVGWLTIPRRLWWHWRLRGHLHETYRLVDTIRREVTVPAGVPAPRTWHAQKLHWTLSDLTVLELGPEGAAPAALLKVAQTPAGQASLQRQVETLRALAADERLTALHPLIPAIYAQATGNGLHYVVEQRLPGLDGRAVMVQPEARAELFKAAVTTISALHTATATPATVDDALFARWVTARLAPVRAIYAQHANGPARLRQIDRLADELRDALMGRSVRLSRVHGDFTPGNVLASADGKQVTGIIDWDQSAPQALPEFDLGLWLLSTRMLVEGRELGPVVCDVLQGGRSGDDLDALQDTLQDALQPPTGDALDLRTVTLLAWLSHVASMLDKAERYRRHRLWLARNVERVLDGF